MGYLRWLWLLCRKSIAYAYLPVDLARPGTAVDVELYGELSAALVAAEPLWDPAGTRIKL